MVLLILHKNIHCDPSSELSQQDDSDEGSQHMVSMRHLRKIIIKYSLLSRALFLWQQGASFLLRMSAIIWSGVHHLSKYWSNQWEHEISWCQLIQRLGWLVDLGLTDLGDSISVYIKPYTRKNRDKTGERKNIKRSSCLPFIQTSRMPWH